MNYQLIQFIRPLFLPILKILRKRKFLKALKENEDKPIKLVVGSSGIAEKSWIPSEYYFLDLLIDSHWKKYFKPDSIEIIIAEHVWEHLTLEQGKIAAKTCYKYLKVGGRARIAVPDGFHKDQHYVDAVKPGGSGAGSEDRKVLYNYKSLSSIFEQAGFKINAYEYFDENHQLQLNDWDSDYGYVSRTFYNDQRNSDGQPHYTSILIDAIKT